MIIRINRMTYPWDVLPMVLIKSESKKSTMQKLSMCLNFSNRS